MYILTIIQTIQGLVIFIQSLDPVGLSVIYNYWAGSFWILFPIILFLFGLSLAFSEAQRIEKILKEKKEIYLVEDEIDVFLPSFAIGSSGATALILMAHEVLKINKSNTFLAIILIMAIALFFRFSYMISKGIVKWCIRRVTYLLDSIKTATF